MKSHQSEKTQGRKDTTKGRRSRKRENKSVEECERETGTTKKNRRKRTDESMSEPLPPGRTRVRASIRVRLHLIAVERCRRFTFADASFASAHVPIRFADDELFRAFDVGNR